MNATRIAFVSTCCVAAGIGLAGCGGDDEKQPQARAESWSPTIIVQPHDQDRAERARKVAADTPKITVRPHRDEGPAAGTASVIASGPTSSDTRSATATSSEAARNDSTQAAPTVNTVDVAASATDTNTTTDIEALARSSSPEPIVDRFMQAYRAGDAAGMLDVASERTVAMLAAQRRQRLAALQNAGGSSDELSAADARTMTDREVLLQSGRNIMSAAKCGPFEILDVANAGDEAVASIVVRAEAGNPEMRFDVIAVRADDRWRIDLQRTLAIEQAAFILAWSNHQPTRTAVVDNE